MKDETFGRGLLMEVVEEDLGRVCKEECFIDSECSERLVGKGFYCWKRICLQWIVGRRVGRVCW